MELSNGLILLSYIAKQGRDGSGTYMQTCVGQNCGHACNSMELFHGIDFLTCQPSITRNSFQAITHHTNLPCYYHLYISRLLQGCIFHALSWRRCVRRPFLRSRPRINISHYQFPLEKASERRARRRERATEGLTESIIDFVLCSRATPRRRWENSMAAPPIEKSFSPE